MGPLADHSGAIVIADRLVFLRLPHRLFLFQRNDECAYKNNTITFFRISRIFLYMTLIASAAFFLILARCTQFATACSFFSGGNFPPTSKMTRSRISAASNCGLSINGKTKQLETKSSVDFIGPSQFTQNYGPRGLADPAMDEVVVCRAPERCTCTVTSNNMYTLSKIQKRFSPVFFFNQKIRIDINILHICLFILY